jgi:hypothetical protein
MKISRYIYIIASVLMMTGCTNFLSVKPQGKIIPETEEEFAAVFNYRLNNLEAGSYDQVLNNGELIAKYEAYSDDLNANITIGNLPIYAGTEFNKNYSLYKDWYAVIKDCNIIIDAMSKKTSDHARQLSAAAKGMKGACYYNLLRNYCKAYDSSTASKDLGLCIIDKFDIDIVPPRSDLETTANYVISTLRSSIAYGITDDKYVFNVDVVKAFLAKALFWAEDWEEAYDICEELCEKYPMVSRDEYVSVINSQFEKGTGIIVRSRINNNNSSSASIRAQALSDISSRPVNHELLQLFAPYNEKDIRYTSFFSAKRKNTKEPFGKIRASELHLMMAECLAHQGQDQAALDIINNLRANRIIDYTPYELETLPEVDPDAVIKVDALGKPLTPLTQAILNERRMEMYMEGDRWFELKRNGSPEFTIITDHIGIWQKYTMKAYMYTFPINKDDVDLKDYIKQNEGYEEYL